MTDVPTPEPAPAPAPAPAPTAPEGFVPKEVYDREVEDRKRERNLYKPYATVFAPLAPEQREAILGMAEMVGLNDTEGIIDWSLSTAENVSGKTHAELIAARQAATPVGTPSVAAVPGEQQPVTAPGLTADEVRRILEEDRAKVQRQMGTQEQIRVFTEKMTAAGITPASDEGAEVIEMCRAYRGDMDKALRVFKLGQQDAANAAAATAVAAGQTPAPAPNGTPAPNAPAEGLTHRQKVMARLTQPSSA
jgi:hypothetical protein